MNRSGWITGTIVVQALWAVALVGFALFLLILSRTAGSEASAELKTGATVLGVSGLLAIVSWYGLWKETLWGWWLALITDFALLSMFIYSMVDDGLGNIDWEMAGITLTSAIVPIFLLIPVVRRFYWHITTTQSSAL